MGEDYLLKYLTINQREDVNFFQPHFVESENRLILPWNYPLKVVKVHKEYVGMSPSSEEIGENRKRKGGANDSKQVTFKDKTKRSKTSKLSEPMDKTPELEYTVFLQAPDSVSLTTEFYEALEMYAMCQQKIHSSLSTDNLISRRVELIPHSHIDLRSLNKYSDPLLSVLPALGYLVEIKS